MDKNTELQDIAALMRSEWDDRINSDYRYWMSDGVDDDVSMWNSGIRDFDILTKYIPSVVLKESSTLDVGCGVGRIVYPASEKVKNIVGIDVSTEAISTAKNFNRPKENIKFIVGNGLDLSVLQDNSFDLLISFAALCSIPSRVFAKYLCEFGRVVKIGGTLRIQIYLGNEQALSEEDTLALRSYDLNRFKSALELVGFNFNYAEEVNLDFEVSDYDKGVVAYIVGAERINVEIADFSKVFETLISSPEKVVGLNWQGSETASYVALARVRQLIEKKDLNGAKNALQLAKKTYHGDNLDIKIIVNDLERELESKNNLKQINISNSNHNISEKFTEIITEEGPCLIYKGIALSHQVKPKEAAKNWATRTLKSLEFKDSSILIVGAGDSNFALALKNLTEQNIIIYEEDLDLIKYSKNRFENTFRYISKLNELDYILSDETTINLVVLPSAPFYMQESVEVVRKKHRKKYLIKGIKPNIGIVGPLYGGTLPIAGYIETAFKNLGQRVEYIDLSGYLGTYNSFDKFLKNKSTKDVLEHGFVNLMSDLVYQIVEERKLDIIISVALAPISPTILEKLNKKGVITAHWFMEDTKRFSTWKNIAKYYDYFFIFQKGESMAEVKNAGGNRVHYLPLAFSQQFHKQIVLTPQEIEEFGSKLSFVGAGYNNRRHIFSKLADLDVKIWGSEWPDMVPFKRMVQRAGARISVEDYVKIFNSSDININLHSSHERDGIDPSGDSVNPRTFELAGCKAFQLVDERTLLPELFEVDKEIITFNSLSDLREKINFYQNQPDLRKEITNKAYERALNFHTYEKRLEEMLEIILLDFGDSIKMKIEQGPWPKTLEACKDKPDLASRLRIIQEKGEEPTLEALVGDITQGKGKLSDVEMKLMFLHHMRGQITQVNKLRNGSGV